jgi:hypothetical protein
LQTKDLKNVALAVYRERRRELPVLPKSRIEAHEALKSINLNTNKDESFMMVNDQENGIIIFTCMFMYRRWPGMSSQNGDVALIDIVLNVHMWSYHKSRILT